MEPIPKPEVLDADRILRDDREDMSAAEHRSQAQLLDAALHQSCAYANQLWDTLDAVRIYLYASLDDIAGTSADTAASRGLQPEDESAWQAWIDTAAAATSVLCGPYGDSGFGRERAEQEAQQRRAPAPSLAAVIAPPAAPATHTPPVLDPSRPDSATTTSPAHRSHDNRRRLLTGVLVALALRGLRPRRAAKDPFGL